MDSVSKLTVSDFENIEVFIECCYSQYLDIWNNNPSFNKKPIYRNKDLDKDKEKDFWGVTEGHKDNVVYEDLRRYENIPIFKYIIINIKDSNNTENDDIIWFEFDRKINVLSKKYNYFVVLKETTNSVILITGYPITESKTIKKIKKWNEYNQSI